VTRPSDVRLLASSEDAGHLSADQYWSPDLCVPRHGHGASRVRTAPAAFIWTARTGRRTHEGEVIQVRPSARAAERAFFGEIVEPDSMPLT